MLNFIKITFLLIIFSLFYPSLCKANDNIDGYWNGKIIGNELKIKLKINVKDNYVILDIPDKSINNVKSMSFKYNTPNIIFEFDSDEGIVYFSGIVKNNTINGDIQINNYLSKFIFEKDIDISNKKVYVDTKNRELIEPFIFTWKDSLIDVLNKLNKTQGIKDLKIKIYSNYINVKGSKNSKEIANSITNAYKNSIVKTICMDSSFKSTLCDRSAFELKFYYGKNGEKINTVEILEQPFSTMFSYPLSIVSSPILIKNKLFNLRLDFITAVGLEFSKPEKVLKDKDGISYPLILNRVFLESSDITNSNEILKLIEDKYSNKIEKGISFSYLNDKSLLIEDSSNQKINIKIDNEIQILYTTNNSYFNDLESIYQKKQDELLKRNTKDFGNKL